MTLSSVSSISSVPRLEDHSLEIPRWLLRNKDGSFKHPDEPRPLIAPVTEPVTAAPAVPRLSEADKQVIRQIERELSASAEGKRLEREAARRAEKKETQERLSENKKRQRRVFVQHFKWGLDI